MSNELLTVSDVAQRLTVSVRYVLDEIRRKNLRASKLGGKAGWRVTETDLQTYMDAIANVAKVRRSA